MSLNMTLLVIAEMEISMANFTSRYFLSLFLEYDPDDQNIELDAFCDHSNLNISTFACNALAISFIQSTQCIEKEQENGNMDEFVGLP